MHLRFASIRSNLGPSDRATLSTCELLGLLTVRGAV